MVSYNVRVVSCFLFLYETSWVFHIYVRQLKENERMFDIRPNSILHEVLEGERNVLWINLTPQEGDLSQERLLHYRLFLLKTVLVELYDLQKNIKYC